MIKLIGVKRTIFLAALLLLNLVITTAFLLGVYPARLETETELAAVNGKISQTSAAIQNIRQELEAYKGNYLQYKALENRGFFSEQDRFEAGRVLDSLRAQSGLLGYAYNIGAIRAVPYPGETPKTGSLINSRITLDNVTSVLDMNVYTLLHNITTAFPAHARINKFSIAKNTEVTEQTLASVAQGSGGFIAASVEMDWLTMVPKLDAPQGLPGAYGGRP